MNTSLSTIFVMSYASCIIAELNMMVVRLSGATSFQDRCHCPSSGPVSRRQLTRLPSRRSTKPTCKPSVRMRRPSFPHPI